MPRQLLVRQASPRGVPAIHLPLKQFAQQLHGVARPVLR